MIQPIVTKNPKRRWYQFSLRTLLVFGLLVSICMSWLAVKLHRGRKQRKAVEAIERLGGEVCYGYEFPVNSWKRKPQASAWLKVLVGDDLSRDVIHAFGLDANHVVVKHVSHDNITCLSRLTTLEYLCIDSTQISDRELERLQRLKNLRMLSLGDIIFTTHGTFGRVAVNPEAVKKLEEALPECHILY